MMESKMMDGFEGERWSRGCDGFEAINGFEAAVDSKYRKDSNL